MNATKILMALFLALTNCATEESEGICPEPVLVEHPHTCHFYLTHSEDVPDTLCRVSNVFHDPVLGSPPVLTDKIGIWVTVKHRLDADGQWCGNSYGAIVSQQYRPGWDSSFPDCVWVACSEFAEISSLPHMVLASER
jgi:hypothetical protein